MIDATDDLHGREPEREVAPGVLDVEREEALERAEDGAVEHRGLVLVAVAADVAEPEAPGHGHVDLDRRERPGAAEHVAEVALDLGRVEGGLARLDAALVAGAPHRLDQRLLGLVPVGRVAEELLGPGRDGDPHAREPERADRPRPSSRRSGGPRPRPGRARSRCARRPAPWRARARGRSACRCARCGGAARTRPGGAAARGRSACAARRCWQWPGQFIGLTPSSSPSSPSNQNMSSWNSS